MKALFLTAMLWWQITEVECQLEILSGTWKGTTSRSTSSVQITYSEDKISIEDFTAGFIEAVGHESVQLPAVLQISCQGTIEKETIASEFGDFIISGKYDEQTGALILDWSNPNSGIKESVTFTKI